MADENRTSKPFRMIGCETGGDDASRRVAQNYRASNIQGIENIQGLLSPERITVFEWMIPVAQAETVVVEGQDAI